MKIKICCNIILLSLFCLQCLSQEQFSPDSTINCKFVLNNCKSIQDFYKDFSQIRLQDEISLYNPFGYSFVAFVNKDTSLYLIAFEYDGDSYNSYSAFEVGYVTDEFYKCISKYYVTEYNTFNTESGICLNMSLDQLLNLKGKECCTIKDNAIIYYLDVDNSVFVQRHKSPEYYLKCELNKGKICKFYVGFPYP